MSTDLTITDASQLVLINRIIHDRWFDVGEVRFHGASRTLVVEFLRPRLEPSLSGRRRSLIHDNERPLVESFLQIRHVAEWVLTESQYIGSYDFNELRFDPVKMVVEIATGIPLAFYAQVTELEVSVMVTDKVVKEKRR